MKNCKKANLYDNSKAYLNDDSKATFRENSQGTIQDINFCIKEENCILLENATLKDYTTKTIYQSGNWKYGNI